ncbi:MAG TPA: polysaccharide deacetylase family protein [Chitinophagaceae bacterium]|nr:polysaccharide deacetylase family protein [Chitinophagaceae bacterium]
MENGKFVISLDFEIHWGVSDHRTIQSYYENLSNVPTVVKRSLQLFKEKNIHATWATVGMLFCRNKNELFSFVSEENRPRYHKEKYSNYLVAMGAGESEEDDPFHYAGSLINEIQSTPHQEVATHTFSHYYCLEKGQTPEQFYYDIKAAKEIAEREQIKIRSIVFPRNQMSSEYLEKCKINDVTCYRGNFPSSIYRFRSRSSESLLKRAARFIDTYLPLTGNRYVDVSESGGMLNVPASCFLRPYSSTFSWLEWMRLLRIKREMKAAAKKNKIYHLWWHPHNFGKSLENNFQMLNNILNYYLLLSQKYNMQSFNMAELLDLYTTSKNKSNEN